MGGVADAVWRAGLPQGALTGVPRLADADAVIHVRPRPGQRHYQYDEVGAGRHAMRYVLHLVMFFCAELHVCM